MSLNARTLTPPRVAIVALRATQKPDFAPIRAGTPRRPR